MVLAVFYRLVRIRNSNVLNFLLLEILCLMVHQCGGIEWGQQKAMGHEAEIIDDLPFTDHLSSDSLFLDKITKKKK